MKSITIKYKTTKRLLKFLNSDIFLEANNQDIVLQIFYPHRKENLLKDIINTVKKKYSNTKIIGCDSEEVLLNKTTSEDIILNFLFFSKDSVKVQYLQNSYFDIDNLSDLNFIYSIDLDRNNLINMNSESNVVIATFHHNSILYDDKLYHTGLVLLSIKKEFTVDIKVVDYVEPIGRELKFDKIDKKSLQNIYSHYLSREFAKNLTISSYKFPLLKKYHDEYKASLIFEKDDEIYFDFDVEKEDIFKIGFSNSVNFYKKYIDTLKSFDNCHSDFFFVVSSIAKRSILDRDGFDFESAVGFFSKSELAIVNGKVYDMNLSIIMININSISSSALKYPYYKEKKYQKDDFYTIEALTNIAKISSQELETLNKNLEKRVAEEVEKNLKKDAILIHQSRLAQMGEMISLIAHQWKQPLSAISATSSGLQIKIELDMYDRAFFLKSLAKIEEFVNHLSTTIDDFSNFFKPTKIKKDFYLDEAIKKALNIASYSLSKNSIDIATDLQGGIKIVSYENELIQVLLNLLKNAENILIKRKIKKPKICIKMFEREGKKYIQVIDNGGGVDEDIKEKIFEPYFSTKATKNSTGLGLYMSRFIVEDSLGGKLLLENSSSGAVFSIVLV